jgi:hypothetical protein
LERYSLEVGLLASLFQGGVLVLEELVLGELVFYQ